MNAREIRENAHQMALSVESRRTALASLDQSLQRMQGQLAQFESRRSEIAAQLASGSSPVEGLESERQTHLNQRQLAPAKAELVKAGHDFEQSRRQVRTLRRFLPFARVVPLLGSQIQGVDDLAGAGVLLSDAGVRLVDAASSIIEPSDQNQKLSDALDRLRGVEDLLQAGVASIDAAGATVDKLEGKRLVRPPGRARTDLARRLPEIRRRATDAQEALASMITFAGGEGPRRYLVLSQNPDEVRPTGGFIGTYGVLEAVSGQLSLERYDSIESWITPRPEAVATPAERGSPLRLDTRRPQSLANVNTWPDWLAAISSGNVLPVKSSSE